MSGDFILIGDLVRSVVLLQVIQPRETDPRYFSKVPASRKKLTYINSGASLHCFVLLVKVIGFMIFNILDSMYRIIVIF